MTHRATEKYFASTDEAIAAYYEQLCACLIESLEAIGSGSGHAGVPGDSDLRYATLVWVTLFDERAVVDLTRRDGLTPAVAAAWLTGTLLATLRYRHEGDRGPASYPMTEP